MNCRLKDLPALEPHSAVRPPESKPSTNQLGGAHLKQLHRLSQLTSPTEISPALVWHQGDILFADTESHLGVLSKKTVGVRVIRWRSSMGRTVEKLSLLGPPNRKGAKSYC